MKLFKQTLLGLVLIVLVAGTFWTGCQSNSGEATALAAAQGVNDVVDAAMKSWAYNWETRYKAAEAALPAPAAAATIMALAEESGKAKVILNDYHMAYRTALAGWIAVKDVTGTNGPPSLGQLLAFSNQLDAAAMNAVTLFRNLSH